MKQFVSVSVKIMFLLFFGFYLGYQVGQYQALKSFTMQVDALIGNMEKDFLDLANRGPK